MSESKERIDFTGERRRQRIILIAGVCIVVVIICGSFLWWNFVVKPNAQSDQSQSSTEEMQPEDITEPVEEEVISVETRVKSLLTGELVAPEVANLRPVIVSVENHTSSRPPTGLIDADIVYELPVEGGITRFLAVYQQNQPEKVGPERSARVYMLDWVKEYNAVFAHIGQDPMVLSLINPYGVNDLRDFGAWWDPPSTGRSQEHRAYTSIVKLRDAMADRSWNADYALQTWTFADNESLPSERPAGQTIRVNYGSLAFTSTWNYNSTDNVYTHSYGNDPHLDASNNQQMWAKDILVLKLQIWQRAGDEKGRKDMKVEGEGDAILFRDGQRIDGRWTKPGREDRTKVTDAAGNEVTFNPGKIWVHVVPAFEDNVTVETDNTES